MLKPGVTWKSWTRRNRWSCVEISMWPTRKLILPIQRQTRKMLASPKKKEKVSRVEIWISPLLGSYSSLQHNIPRSFCLVLVFWNLISAFPFFSRDVIKIKREISALTFVFALTQCAFVSYTYFATKQFVNYVFFIHLLFQKVLVVPQYENDRKRTRNIILEKQSPQELFPSFLIQNTMLETTIL